MMKGILRYCLVLAIFCVTAPTWAKVNIDLSEAQARIKLLGAPKARYLADLTEYYLYLAEKEPSIKSIKDSPNYNRRVEALVNVFLQTIGMGLARPMNPDSPELATYTMGSMSTFFNTPEEIASNGYKDIVAGNYKSAKALVLIDSYRAYIMEAAAKHIDFFNGKSNDGKFFDYPAQMEPSLQARNMEYCNYAFFAYAVTRPAGEFNGCFSAGAEIYGFGKEMSVLAPKSAEANSPLLPFSGGMEMELITFTKFLANSPHDLKGDQVLRVSNKRHRQMMSVAVAEDTMKKLISQQGGQEKWTKLSELEHDIADTQKAIQQKGTLSEMQATNAKLRELCVKRQEDFPTARKNKACQS